MVNLIGILDTETNRHMVELDGDISRDKAVIRPLDGKLRTGTFRDLIGYMVDGVQSEDKQLADEVTGYVQQHNGSSTICEIRACDNEGSYINSNSSTIRALDEGVAPYIKRRSIDDEDFDCIEMVVGQITSVGARQ
ncbi:MAG: hypothetical protein AABY09_00370 [Nanoarchaeota archaeon]